MKLKPSEAPPEARRSRSNTGYAVTIVYNVKRFVSVTELYLKLNDLKVKLSKYGTEWSDNIAIELKDTTNVLHLHTYCTCTRSPWVKPETGWNIQLKKIKPDTEQFWIKYINKYDPHPCAIQQRETLSQLYLTPVDSLFTPS